MNSGADNPREFTEKLKKVMKSSDWAANMTAEVNIQNGLHLSPAFLDQLHKKNSNLPSRLVAIKQLTSTVKEKVIKEDQVEKIWLLMEDLLLPAGDEGARHVALALLTAVAVSANAVHRFGAPMRHIIFNYVADHCRTEAIEPLFNLFSAALVEGKNLELVVDLVGQFYNSWYPTLLQSSKSDAAIEFFINLTKTNAAFLDEPELLGLVKETVRHMNSTNSEREGLLCLKAVETVVAYSHLPSIMLKSVTASLARITSIPTHTEHVWKLMRTIMGTYLGDNVVFTLCDIISCAEITDHHITRGCVFFLHSALWGTAPIPSIDIPYYLALPILKKASEHPHELVIYEVAFALKQLVTKMGSEIHPHAWHNIFYMVSKLYKFAFEFDDGFKAQALINVINDTVDQMEQLRDNDRFCVKRVVFYTFLLPFTPLRTENSTLKVVSYLTKDALDSSTESEDWLERLRDVLHRHYFREDRTAVRLHALTCMTDSIKGLGKARGTAVIERVVLPAVRNCLSETIQVRCAVIDVLGHIAYEHNHPIMTECMHLLIAITREPFKQANDGSVPEHSLETARDVVKAVDWLILVFKRRIWDLPSSDAITAFSSLLAFLESHYKKPALFFGLPQLRAKILELIFQIRANHRYEIGLPEVDDAQIGYGMPTVPGLDRSILPKYTPYIIIDHAQGNSMAQLARMNMITRRFTTDEETSPKRPDRPCSAAGLDKTASYEVTNESSVFSSVNQSVTLSDDLEGDNSGSGSGSSKDMSFSSEFKRIEKKQKAQEMSFGTGSHNTSVESSNMAATSTPLFDIKAVASKNAAAACMASKPTALPANLVTHQDSSNFNQEQKKTGGAASGSSDGEVTGGSGASTEDELINECMQAAAKLRIGRDAEGNAYVISGKVPTLPASDDPWREAQRHATITYLSLKEVVGTVILAMRTEKDWNILKLILDGTTKILQNKALIVSRESNFIDYISDAIIRVLSDRSLNLPASLINTPDKFLRPDFEQHVYLALSGLSCYKTQLSVEAQVKMVDSIRNGMVSKCGGVCITALTLCCLEMPKTMVRNLPNILHSLTKISATVISSQPVLEFLSTLLHLPHIYSNFSSDQYMAVFAIVIPYTNPVKFNQYVVILAFHVLAMWFLKCKISNRKNFVNFIAKNLKNVLGNEPRRRSVSLSSESSAAAERLQVYLQLHEHLRTVLIDLMSRYAYASCRSMARRSEVGEALVGCGQQQTWMVGLKLFTITTSGCTQRPMTADGVCENCAVACKHLTRFRKGSTGQSSRLHKSEGSKDVEGDGGAGRKYPMSTEKRGSEGEAGNLSGLTSAADDSSSSSSFNKSSSSRPMNTSGINQTLKEPQSSSNIKDHHLCTCWCVGYAEIYVRQPTGNMAWMIRLQNHQQILTDGKQLTLNPSITPGPDEIFPPVRPAELSRMLFPDPEQHLSLADESCSAVARLRRQSSGRRGSDCTGLSGGPRQTRLTSGGSDEGQAAADGTEAREPAGLSIGSTIGGPRTTSVDEEEEIEEAGAVDRVRASQSSAAAVAAAVQRSLSNPEIGENTVAPPPSTTDSSNQNRAVSRQSSSGGASGNIPAALTLKPGTPFSSTQDGLDYPLKTPTDGDMSSGPLRSSTPGGAVGSAAVCSSPTVPPSPSKLFSRIGSKFNSNINKYFGNPSAAASASGPTSPSPIITDGAATSGSGKRMRHASALSASNTSSSQPNVCDVSGTKPQHASPQTRKKNNDDQESDGLGPIRRGRGHTISVMNPASRPLPPTLETPLSPLAATGGGGDSASSVSQELFARWARPKPGSSKHDQKAASNKGRDTRGGVTPSNVLLQLMYTGNLEKSFERPMLVPVDTLGFSVDTLDYTPPIESHYIGVLYVGPGQSTEQEILGNRIGSTRYQRFLRGLGTLVSIKKVAKDFFPTGLDHKGEDGEQCCIWQDEIMQVSFHVATLMPNDPKDPKLVKKKRHIGNDAVNIVYNESGKPYERDTIKSQFNTVIVEVRPAEHESNTVHQLIKPIVRELLTATPVVRLVSDDNLPLYARQIALHSVIACRVQRDLLHPEPYAGAWLVRLRQIYRLRKRLVERQGQADQEYDTDFTDLLEKR